METRQQPGTPMPDALSFHDLRARWPSLPRRARLDTLRAAADQAARDSLLLTRQGYALGNVSYLQLLIAQQQAQQTALSLIAAQSQRLADTVGLYQSMGGGWTHDEMTVEPNTLPRTEAVEGAKHP